MTTILLVDDHVMMREGLKALLDNEDMHVIGEASDGREAVTAARELKPDVILMDIGMPGMNGIEAARLITRENTHAQIIMLTMHADDSYVRQALKAGAKGYVLKTGDERELLKAIGDVAEGRPYFSSQVQRVLLDGYMGGDTGIDTALDLLSAREREVLQLIAEGYSNRAIAERMEISISTVETHRKHIMSKLDLHNTAEVVRFAVQHKVVQHA